MQDQLIVKDLFIDGEPRESASGRRYPRIDPAGSAEIGSFAQAGVADVDAAVKAARRSFDEGVWANTAPAERAAVMLHTADLLQARSEEFAWMESRTSGAPIA